MTYEQRPVDLLHSKETAEPIKSSTLVYGSREMIVAFERLARIRFARMGELVVGKFSQLTIESIPLEEAAEA